VDLSPREIKAIEIADRFRIAESSGKWIVPSQTHPTAKYGVRIVGEYAECDCPDYELRRDLCKHILAVQLVIKRERNADGTTTVIETFTVAKRRTYKQDWPAYNLAQTTEKDHFQVLLADLCRDIPSIPQTGRGQRRLPLRDVIYAATFKVFSTMSGRRFMSDLREARERGHIETTPHYNSIFRYLENKELTPILNDLVITASLPLKAVETDFAADSTGFGVSRFDRWFSHKYGRETFQRQWIKVHIMCGVKTNVVTAVEIADKNAADVKMLPSLVETTADNFKLSEVSADKAYLSTKNVIAIRDAGAMPFIAFKTNSTERGEAGKSQMWRDMFYFFMWKRDEFLKCYHKRSNVESAFSMMKRKFGDGLRSRTDVAMINEALCKILCHNLSVLIHEIHELGITPLFSRPLL